VDRLFSRTRALRPKQFDAIWGLWRTETRADRQLELAEEMVRIATAADDRQLLLQAHHAQWATQFNRGDLQDALVHVDAAVGLYRQEVDGKDPSRFGGHDPLCCGHGVAALCQWAIGRPRAARQHLESALTLARRLADAHTLAHTLDYAIMLAHHLRDLPLLEHYADEAKAHAEQNGLPHYLARATAFLAWHSGTLSPDEAALQRLQEALAVLQPIGDEEDFTFFLDLLAERCKDCGRHEEALAALERARSALSQQRGVRYWEPELIRHAAMVLMDTGESGRGKAVALLQEALALALERGHLTLALRAALTLVESGNDRPEHREALSGILAQLEESSELAEGRRAQELLRREP
jgi:tetratricopeptide (TPR) repeat protein